jgi:hypothetical protein
MAMVKTEEEMLRLEGMDNACHRRSIPASLADNKQTNQTSRRSRGCQLSHLLWSSHQLGPKDRNLVGSKVAHAGEEAEAAHPRPLLSALAVATMH